MLTAIAITISIILTFIFIERFFCESSSETNKHSEEEKPPQDQANTRHSAVHSAQEIAAKIPSSIQSHFNRLVKYFTTATVPEERIVTDEFRQVAKLLQEKHPVVLVTGGAGTGKTTLIEWLSENGLADVIVAFTGMAALNCHGKTIHSLFQLPMRLILPEDYLRLHLLKWESVSLLKNTNILVIDEISMVRADLLDALNYRLQCVRENPEPFGGVQLLLVGDPYQLPPVIANQEREYFSPHRPQCKWRSGWFFDAKCLKDISITSLDLTRVFRQAPEEAEYISHLNRLRKYQNMLESIEYFNKNCFRKHQDKDIVTLTADNATATVRNKIELDKLPNNSVIFEATATGAFAKTIRNLLEYSRPDDPDAINDMKRLPAPYHLELKVSALVMLLVNDGMKRFVNGSTGIVQKIAESAITIRLNNGNIIEITKNQWDSEKLEWDHFEQRTKRSLDGTFTQFPLMLSWAITTHKSQGRTLPAARVEFLRNAFSPGQTYVALSRTRKISDLYLSRPLYESDFPQDFRLNEWLFHIDETASNNPCELTVTN